MKTVRISILDYLRIVAVFVLVVGFFSAIAWLEWHRATPGARTGVVVVIAGFSLLWLLPLWIYRPHTTRIDLSTVVAGPKWSADVMDLRFYWVDIATRDGERKRIRFVDVSDLEYLEEDP
jgi:hypothetical protein